VKSHVPARYGHRDGMTDLDTYFSMARGINSSFVIDTVKEDAPIPLDHLK
jgi:hypothetical protein